MRTRCRLFAPWVRIAAALALLWGGIALIAPIRVGATGVPCDPAALVSAIDAANSGGGTLDLTPGCV